MDADRLERLRRFASKRPEHPPKTFAQVHPYQVLIPNGDGTYNEHCRCSNFSLAARTVRLLGIATNAVSFHEPTKQTDDFYTCSLHVSKLRWRDVVDEEETIQ